MVVAGGVCWVSGVDLGVSMVGDEIGERGGCGELNGGREWVVGALGDFKISCGIW